MLIQYTCKIKALTPFALSSVVSQICLLYEVSRHLCIKLYIQFLQSVLELTFKYSITTIFGTKFSMFCSPHPNGILIRLARFGMLGPSTSPRYLKKYVSYSISSK